MNDGGGRHHERHLAPVLRTGCECGRRFRRAKRVSFFPASAASLFPQARARGRQCPRLSAPSMQPSLAMSLGPQPETRPGQLTLPCRPRLVDSGRQHTHSRKPHRQRRRTPGRHSARRGARRERRAARRETCGPGRTALRRLRSLSGVGAFHPA